MELDRNFSFRPMPAIARPVHFPFPFLPNPLGPLAGLPGKWAGKGFNAIWRPHFKQQDRFLELNLTDEVLTFEGISGPIPNRGLLQDDIDMFGLTYMQQISDISGAGLHIEPGIWAVVPSTTAPAEPATVVRMASIPHGTTILAQGTSLSVNGPPQFDDVNLIPFGVGGVPPVNGANNQAFNQAKQTFPELDLAVASNFRLPSPNLAAITQDMVINPNLVLKQAIAGQNILHTTVLKVSTSSSAPQAGGVPIVGGGTSNTAFLKGAAGGPNAVSARVDAVFWLETVQGVNGAPNHQQLQYTQTVLLNFNGLSWPHVSVATLKPQSTVHLPVTWLDPHIPPELLRRVQPHLPDPGPPVERPHS